MPDPRLELHSLLLCDHAITAQDGKVSAIGLFSQINVTRLPTTYGRLFIAETSPGFAMEQPEGFWIPDSYKLKDVSFAVIHEVAHQWFYALVGNDVTREPWIGHAPHREEETCFVTASV